MPRPEDVAREQIDDALKAAGWAVQDRDAMNVDEARGVAVREFPLRAGFGFADYLLYVDGQAVGGWKRSREKAEAGVELKLLTPLSRAETRAVEAAVRRYGEFLEAPVVVR